MCGLIGYTGPRPAVPILLEGLKRLEYRGYDSAGICVFEPEAGHKLFKCAGKIQDLKKFAPLQLKGTSGIGHTRWATHGAVNDINAHPHLDFTQQLAIAHNGIIENFAVLKQKLEAEGIVFVFETDSEGIAHLISKNYDGDLELAVRKSLPILKGTYGPVCMHQAEPGKVIGAHNGLPLVLGIGENEMFLASDVTPMLAHTKQVIFLEDGEVASLTPQNFHIKDLKDNKIEKTVNEISWQLEEIEKGSFSHFIEKEIYEQPDSIEAWLPRLN